MLETKGRYKKHKRAVCLLELSTLISRENFSNQQVLIACRSGFMFKCTKFFRTAFRIDQRKLEFSGTRQDFWAANNFDPFFSLKAGKYHGLTSLAQSQLNAHTIMYRISKFSLIPWNLCSKKMSTALVKKLSLLEN